MSKKLLSEQMPSHLLPLDPEMPPEDLLRTLRMNALLAHQTSVGRGDELVQILKNTIGQMESTHRRVQNMSIILFASGLVMLAVGVYFVFQGKEVWGMLMGGSGGIASLAATFWTAPLDKMSASICDLVKLEAAFLGYIRVIGELDSAFQMQYLNILSGSSNISLDQVMNDTTQQMKDMMQHTLTLIDSYVAGQSPTLSKLKQESEEMNKRLKSLESVNP
jgi:hypothetical protein